jgi:hypothetical protein
VSANVEPCASISFQGPFILDEMTGRVWSGDRCIDRELMAFQERASLEKPGGEQRRCGVIKATFELLES